MILLDVFKYFSRFVSREALSGFFLASSGFEYDALQAEVLSLPDDRRDASLTALVFGVDEYAVRERISQVAGRYLFVDYSHINTTIDHLDIKTDWFRVSVTVAEPHPSDEDQFAQLIRQDGCLGSIAAIRRAMRNDRDTTAHIDWMGWPQKVSAFAGPELQNSFGWSMDFDVKGVDIV